MLSPFPPTLRLSSPVLQLSHHSFTFQNPVFLVHFAGNHLVLLIILQLVLVVIQDVLLHELIFGVLDILSQVQIRVSVVNNLRFLLFVLTLVDDTLLHLDLLLESDLEQLQQDIDNVLAVALFEFKGSELAVNVEFLDLSDDLGADGHGVVVLVELDSWDVVD